jgi:hypothetical protein
MLALLASSTSVLILIQSDGPAPMPVYAVVVSDASASKASRCVDMMGNAERAFLDVRRDQRSSMSILLTGDSTTALEPVQLTLPPIPFATGKVLEGRAAESRRRNGFLDEVRRLCEAAEAVQVSSIYMAIRRGAEQLRRRATAQEGTAMLLASTDLNETASRAIAVALREPAGTPLRHLPAHIDNTGVDVLICGYAATNGRPGASRTPDRADRLIEVWSALFTDPDAVRFDPFCAQPTIVG